MHPSTWPAPVPRYEPPQHLVRPGPLRTRHGATIAGVWPRVVGHLIDVVLAGSCLVVLVAGADVVFEALPLPLQLLVVLAPSFVVGAAGPVLLGGTPGQTLVGLQMVAHDDGRPLRLGRAAARWGMTVGLWVALCGLPLSWLWSLWDPRRATLHDRLAGTEVVHRRR